MKKSIRSAKHRILIKRLVEARKAAGLTQQAVADRLGKPQSFVAKYENGERRLDVVEFLEIADILEGDAQRIIEAIANAGD